MSNSPTGIPPLGEFTPPARRYTARYLFPVDGPPLPGGTFVIAGSKIVAIEAAGQADVDFGNAAILPGFVNAHTHLDLSDAAGKCPPTPDFTAWLRQVIAHRRHQTPAQIDAAIAFGLAESLRFGVTALGDISAQGASWDPLAAAPLDAIVYHEAIGLSAERAQTTFERVRDWIASRPPSPHCRAGISPHAPYTVGAELLEKLLALSNLPIAIHLAETRAELALIDRREGPFVAFLKDMGVYDDAALAHGFDEWLAAAATFVHANYVDPRRLARFKPRAVVYCPRTHAAFGHEPYPLREFLTAGVTVALGTDSLASNPDLNVLAEARHVYRTFPDIAGDAVLRMLTINGAHALSDDLAARTGALTPGKDATFVVLPLPDRDDADPHRLLFGSEALPSNVEFCGTGLRPVP